jgi:diamine N-acetyltransferase
MHPNVPEVSELRLTRVQDAQDVRRVAALAHEIWHEYYVPLIGAEQVAYMVAKFQSATAMQDQIERGDEYFTICRGGQLVGYAAVRPSPVEQSLFISKLYLRREERGAGNGRRALRFLEELACARGLKLLWLTVNKRNPAVHAYEKCGFLIAESLRIDIGAGFVMDDFRMEKRIEAQELRDRTD